MGFPRLLVLKSNVNQQYLRYKVEKDLEVKGLLQFSGDDVASPFAKFKVERAKEAGNNGLVHIRSCYNNKYWVHSPDQTPLDKFLVAAAAAEPQEDQTKPDYTLFKLTEDPSGAPVIRLCHAKLGRYICLFKAANPLNNSLHLGSENPGTGDSSYDFNVVNWESLAILPRHVMFKADNGKYLDSSSKCFDCDDFGAKNVRNEIIANSDGTIRIKATGIQELWYCNLNNNYMETTKEDNTSKSLFWPIKVADNVIALRNAGSGNFCGRASSYSSDRYRALVKGMTKDVRLVVEEAAISRSIYNVDFHLDHARVYNKTILTVATGKAVNRTSETDTVELRLSYTTTNTSKWDSSVSLKIGVKAEIDVGIPLVEEEKIEISAEFTGSYQWGETKTSENTVETTYNVSVPPMSGVKVSLLATKGTCDVPFSYDQRDLLTDGRRVTYHLDDGIYTGVSSYNFKYEAESFALSQ